MKKNGWEVCNSKWLYYFFLRLVDIHKFASCSPDISFHLSPHLEQSSIKIGLFEWETKKEKSAEKKSSFLQNAVILHLPNSWQCPLYPGYRIYMKKKKKKKLVYSTFRHKLLQFYSSHKSNGLLILCFSLSPGIIFCQDCICCVCRILCITQNFLDTYKTGALWL